MDIAITMKTAPRFRQEPEKVQVPALTTRDREILRYVHSYGLLDSDTIIALVADHSRKPFAKTRLLVRLQRLFHHNYLVRPLSQVADTKAYEGSSPMVYGIGDAGIGELKRRVKEGKLHLDLESLKGSSRKNRVKSYYHIQHTLKRSLFRASIELALRDHPELRVQRWLNGRDQLTDTFVSRIDEEKYPFQPDDYFVLDDNSGQLRTPYFFVELERSRKMVSRRVNKFRAYYLYWKEKRAIQKFGQPHQHFRVLYIAPESLLTTLQKNCIQADPLKKGSSMFLFTALEWLNLENPELVLDSVWLTPHGQTQDDFVSILGQRARK